MCFFIAGRRPGAAGRADRRRRAAHATTRPVSGGRSRPGAKRGRGPLDPDLDVDLHVGAVEQQAAGRRRGRDFIRTRRPEPAPRAAVGDAPDERQSVSDRTAPSIRNVQYLFTPVYGMTR